MTEKQLCVLRENRLFGCLDSYPGTLKTVNAEGGEEISPGKGIGLITDGHLSVMRADLSERVLLNRLGPGDLFGMANLYGGENRSTAIIADEKTEILFLPEDGCRKLVRENPGFAEEYIALLSDKIRFLNRRVSDFSSRGVESKVSRALLSGNYISKTMTGLSRQLGIGRASLYRVLDLFEKEGIIEKNGRSVAVTDREKLSEHI